MYLTSDSQRVDDKQHLFSLTEHTIHTISYLYVCTVCFGLYLGYPHACQNENLTKEDTKIISVLL